MRVNRRQISTDFDIEKAQRLLNTPLRELDKALAEKSLSEFVRLLWPSIDPHDYVHGWHIDAICEHVQAVIRLEILRLLINIPPRHMKLCADSTPVLTTNGWVTHGDLNIGDWVYSPNGFPTQIVNKTEKSIANRRVVFTDNSFIDCNDDHLWTVYDRCCGKWKTLETRHIAKSKANKSDRSRYILPERQCLHFRPKRQTINPYFLGAWLGDGTSTKPAITQGANDTEIFEYIEKIIGYKQSSIQIHKDTGYITVCYYRQGLIEEIKKLNLFNNKHIPDIYKFASREQRLLLLAGLIDTDGSVDKNGRIRYSTSNRCLAEDIRDLVLSLGCNAYIAEFENPGYGDYLATKGLPHYYVGFNPTFTIPTVIPRKKIVKIDPTIRRVGIRNVEYVENPELGNCITVSNDDGLYLVGKNLTSTHNSIALSVGLTPWAWLQKPALQFLYSSYASSLSIRDGVKARRIIDNATYKEFWSDRYRLTSDQNTKIRFDNDRGGYRICTSVDGMTTGEGGDVIVIDDANNVKEAESETTRQNTNNWFDEVMQSRFNDPKTGALVSIQQRTHAKDLSGHIMAKYGNAYTYLILPCRYEVESRRKNSLRTFHGFTDPRKEDGELLWPDRFGEEEVIALETALGPYACTPYESPILMADLSMKPIGEIKVGDKIIGFGKKEAIENDHRKHRRVHLMESEVKRVFVYHDKPVVKMTLDSGKVIRCTPDHKWYKKHRADYGGLWYGEAKIGTKLCRVCEPEIRQLTLDETRMAGWVAGFFDGDGSVSSPDRGEFRNTNQIKFYQGAGRNKPNCDKLEDYLTRLGFTFTYCTDDRKDTLKGVNFEYRAYSLTGLNLDTHQRFLHHIQPTKWVDRILDGCLGTKWIQQREKVVNIRKQRNETVYALETTTGNYVVWGLASSNSAGQLQQRPSPREGGIIPLDKFQRYKVMPAIETWNRISLTFDTALKEQELNAYSVCQVWVETYRGLFLLYTWRKKCRYPELKRIAKCLCEEWQPHEVLIEDKSTGSVLIQDLQEEKKYRIKAIDPGGMDKVMRMEAEASAIESGLCYLPETSGVIVYSGKAEHDCAWLLEFEAECQDFPNGEYKDQVDPMSQYLKTVRMRRQKYVPIVSPVVDSLSKESHWVDTENYINNETSSSVGMNLF